MASPPRQAGVQRPYYIVLRHNVEEGRDMDHEGPEPRARTLVVFGIGLLLTIVSIIVVAALLGA